MPALAVRSALSTLTLASGAREGFALLRLEELMRRHGIERDEAVAVGDSWRDVPMLEAAGVRVYVGKVLPPGLTAIHLPDGDIGEVARVVTRWPSVSA